jgi:pyruvate/2-oxoglutarate dehydrogenase complex dihydrolipoamide dehydrogenase (E3) component
MDLINHSAPRISTPFAKRQVQPRPHKLRWCDAHCLRTSQAAIHAMGDCINGQASHYIEPIARQAKTIAAAITCCAPEPYEQHPVVVRVKTTSLQMMLH